MRFFTARRLALAALVPVLFVLSVIPGCSNQGEGERCGDMYGVQNNSDCGDNLICTPANELVNGAADGTNRCCYATRVTDSRCTRVTSGDTGTAGGAGVGGSAGTSGASSAGTGGSLSEGGAGEGGASEAGASEAGASEAGASEAGASGAGAGGV